MCELMQLSSNALNPTLGFIQYLVHFKRLEYFLGLHMKGVGRHLTEDQFKMSSEM